MSPFPILKLPAELRTNIFQFALHHGQDLFQAPPECQVVNISLLLLNHQIYTETIPIFYSFNIFRVDVFHQIQSLPSKITQRSHNIVSFVRHIHVRIFNDDWKLSKVNESLIAKILQSLRTCPKLSSIKLTIGWDPSSPTFQRRQSDPQFEDIKQIFADALIGKELCLRTDVKLGQACQLQKLKLDMERWRHMLDPKNSGSILNWESRIPRDSVLGTQLLSLNLRQMIASSMSYISWRIDRLEELISVPQTATGAST